MFLFILLSSTLSDLTIPDNVSADSFEPSGVSGLLDKVLSVFDYIVDMVTSVISAFKEFYQMLVDFDSRIVAMVDTTGTSELSGFPVVEAISTFRFLVGDVVFYLIYLAVLFGCLWTIYKIVILLYDAVDSLINHFTGNSCKSLISSVLGKILG
jgi:hypothetical protein